MAVGLVTGTWYIVYSFFFFFNDTATTVIYPYGHTLSLHDALPISSGSGAAAHQGTLSTATRPASRSPPVRSARASPTRSALRWRSGSCALASVPTWSTTAPTASSATATSRRACPKIGRAHV